MTDELAVDLGGLGDSLSACDSRGAPCALTSSGAVIEFTILRHSSKVYMVPKQINGRLMRSPTRNTARVEVRGALAV